MVSGCDDSSMIENTIGVPLTSSGGGELYKAKPSWG